MLRKRIKFDKIKKSKILKNGKKWSEDMLDSYFSTKFVLICLMVSEKRKMDGWMPSCALALSLLTQFA